MITKKVKFSLIIKAAFTLLFLTALIQTHADESRVELTDIEREWLKNHPVITVTQDPLWPPVEFADSTGKNIGITADYLELIEKRLGISFTRISVLSWQQAYEGLKNHEIDMTTAVSVTPERLKFWDFTDPYLEMPISIMTKSNVTYISSMHELDFKEVAVVDNYAVNEWIPRDYPDIKLIRVSNSLEALELLNDNKVFAYIDNMLIGGYYIAQQKLINIKVAGETPYSNSMAMAVRNDWPIFAGILQKALDSISVQERESIYYKCVPIKYEHGFDYTLLWKITAGFTILITLLVMWIKRLKQEIKQRIAAESAQKESEYQLLLHLNETPVGVIQWDLDYRVKEWNPAAEKIFGYTKDEVRGKKGTFTVPDNFCHEQQILWNKLINGDKIDEYSNYVSEHNITKEGKTITCEWINTPITSAIGELIGVVSLCRDITKEVASQKQIETSLAEKEILLRELYHRTKNNLQLISAYLVLQASFIRNKDVEKLVLSVNSRIQTISLVHEKLCQSNNLSNLNIREYIEDMVSLLLSFQTIGEKKIRINYEIEDIAVSIDTAIPLGLVVNELVTNALKHAFINRTKGILLIQLYRKNEKSIVLNISDDGIGFPEGFDKPATFGIMTTRSIVESQLQGRLEITSNKGTNCHITINVLDKSTAF
ncbi:MAG: transporter substrate-binding domain-containing protein [Spirochaetales bacterium]|nr:transporter substrate-binding domain-containing protein [Spirochaetales bacterium]